MMKPSMVFLGAAVVAVLASAAFHHIAKEPRVDVRAEIEALQSRYMFALDRQQPEAYGDTFTTDGVLIWAGGTVTGRAAIVAEMHQARAADLQRKATEPPNRPWRRRHFSTNLDLSVAGEVATGRSYWFEFNNDTPDRKPYLGAYGHSEDDYRRVDGRWLFARRQIFNEQRAEMAAKE